ncbi:MAG: hypothetical protein Q8L48_36605 [Archangium sp.]|nr:hypothetical protein [Archangium sp.]
MREVTFERAMRAEPARVLQRVEKWLSANGYEVSARSSHELSFVGMSTLGRHRLSVRSDGLTVRFAFAPGAPGVTLPGTSELERRVDASLQELGVAPAAPSPAASGAQKRCSICATVMAAGEKHCPVCGMAN